MTGSWRKTASPVKLNLIVGVVGLLALPSASALAQPAKPAPKAPKACGITAIPLSVGNEWTYEPSLVPPELALTEAQIRATPVQPKKLIIKVTGIETKPETGTVVTLSEDLDGKVHTTTITCTAGGAKFSISPDAFWFSGEPGVAHGLDLTDVERKGHTLSLAAGKLTGLEWRDDMTAKWQHKPVGKKTPKMSKGGLEVLRRYVVMPEETLTLKDGREVKPIKLGLETLVKVTLDPAPAQPLRENPPQNSFFWIIDGTGPVQVLNIYRQQFALTTFVIK